MFWRVILVAAAAGLTFAPLPSSAVERWYSTGLYPALQPLVTRLSNLTAVSLFDVLLVAVLVWFGWRLWDDVSEARARSIESGRRWSRTATRAGLRLVTACAVLDLVFLAMWGLNYRRTPLSDRLTFDASTISVDDARDLARAAVEGANATYGAAHGADSARKTTALADAFAESERSLGVRHPAVTARPKHTILNPYFRAAAVDGMTDPYFLETLVVSDLLPIEQPFVVAHEWSHLAGFANESEANFVGWLTCVRGAGDAQYSGWLYLYSEVSAGLRRSDRAAIAAGLASGPREDLRAIAARVSRGRNQQVSTAGWRVYDRYLKANRVEAGTASYAEVVRLILGTRFGPNWTPVLRN